MQVVSAFSRPQTVPPVPQTVPKRNLWILNSWRDLILYVGTPLLLVPLFTLAQARWSAQDIYLFVAAFGATGHHLPGMIRAYGDRALFERFRSRFIFAPVFLLLVCFAFTWWDLKGIVLVVFFWGVWHGMMQTYGFCRIYDAKAGSFAALTRRLDFAMCGVWFATAVLLSPQRMADTLETYYSSGGPYVPAWFLHDAQQVLLAAAVGVSVVFLSNFILMWVRGQRPNPVKLALLATSISFWWYCNNWVTNILAGIALFEVFHDVQYLSIVWIYNRARVEKDRTIGGFMQFVFRRSGSLVGLYVGLVFAYGSLGLLKEVQIDMVKRVLTGLVAASGLLHFYYDGFIWKVRERSTRENLGLAGGSATSESPAPLLPSWMLHGLKWVGVFMLPLGLLSLGEMRVGRSQVQSSELVVSDVPNTARAHLKYGDALLKADHLAEAAREFGAALALDPNAEGAHYHIGQIDVEQNKPAEAIDHLTQAVDVQPHSADVRVEYADALARVGRKSEAGEEYKKAVQLSPKTARIHYNYGLFLADNRDIDGAIEELQAAVNYKPDLSHAHYYLARMLFLKGELQGAKNHYLTAGQLDPKAPVHNSIGVIHMRLGDKTAAIGEFREALRINPNDADAAENLRLALRDDSVSPASQP